MNKLIRLAGMVAGLSALGLPCLTAARAEAAAEALVRKIIVFKPHTAPAQRLRIAQASGGAVVRELAMIDAVVIELPTARMRIAEAKLKGHDEVLRIDEDPRINWLLASAPQTFADLPLPDFHSAIKPFRRGASDPDDTRPRPKPPIPQPPAGQEIQWGVKRVNAPAAWEKTRGQGVKVVVIDTGVDYDHPDLKANMAGGWNAITKGPDYKDDHGHGTHCAGNIAALDNDIGVVGVAPKVSLYGVKVLDAGGSGTFDDVIAGMQWAVDNKMQIASMSLGASQGNESLKAAVDAMVKAGVALVAAAGNSGPGDDTVGYPAAYPGAIAIAAMDSSDQVAYFSSRGPQVALIAPGVNVKSTVLGGGYESMSGTSMATPHVSGLAALAVAAKGVSGYEGVKAALTAAATPLKDVPATHQGAGAVDAAALVK